MNQEIVTTEWYNALVEECQAIMTESVFNSRWSLIEGYHLLGKRIREEKTPVTKYVGNLAQDMNMSERNIWYAVQFFDAFPTLDALPEGKNISWTKVRKLLPAAKGDIEEQSSVDIEAVVDRLFKKYEPSIAAQIIALWQERVDEIAEGGVLV